MTTLESRNEGMFKSIYGEWFTSFSVLLIVFLFLFILFATRIIFTRLDLNISSLLERALTIAWEEYDRYFQSSSQFLSGMAAAIEEQVLDVNDPKLGEILASNHSFDLWFVVDNNGEVLAASGNRDAPLLEQLAVALKPGWESGQRIATSELLSLESLQSYDPQLAAAANLGEQDADASEPVLLQLTAVPFQNERHRPGGALVAAHLLNNDNTIANTLAAKIPDSFSTISATGIRVSGNISSELHDTYLGQRQIPEHVKTIQADQRFYGRVYLADDLDHLVVSDPIHDYKGNVIGALTIGHPSQGLASLKEDTAFYIILSTVVCWLLIAIGAALAPRKSVKALGNLSKLAGQIYKAESIRPEHVALVNALEPASTWEIQNLQTCFKRMTLSLYEKNQEVMRYLDELEKERNELKRLTEQLQEANNTLETRVQEKTFELRHALTELRTISNHKSKFLANTSHELRTPLNSIIGFSEALLRGLYGELNARQRDRIETIHDSANHLLRLVNDLLDISLIEQGRISVERQFVHTRELFDSVLAVFRSQCEKNDIQLTVERSTHLPETLFVDPTRIRQVLSNVFSNAVRFTPAGGRIDVTVTSSTAGLTVQVKDTGVGISKREQLYVFDEFYRGRGRRPRQGEGSDEGFGLGLPLAKKLVELHNGRIELRSIRGKGTTVTIHIPAGDKEPSQIKAPCDSGSSQGEEHPLG